jgi:protein-S-isoprenylcysteine O-methyltransferase Ste14
MTEAPTNDKPFDDVAVAENFGHIPARPVSWVVVFLVCGGFLLAGIGLIAATQWVFWAGVGVVGAGTILGWATHAMADVTARVERTRAQRDLDDEAVSH